MILQITCVTRNHYKTEYRRPIRLSSTKSHPRGLHLLILGHQGQTMAVLGTLRFIHTTMKGTDMQLALEGPTSKKHKRQVYS